MPTPRGYIVIVISLALLICGRIFGSGAVEQLGFGLLALVGIALAVVRSGRHDLRIERTLSPSRAGASQPVEAKIAVSNRGRGSAPLLLLEDRLPAGVSGTARFALHGVEPSGHREASYTVRAARRGRYELGPLQISYVDPFGLARVRHRALEASTFLVHPRIERLNPPRDFGERRSLASAARKQPTGARGEDFYTLREYVEGDDLRKVHWPSTAKRGKYMIRQEETPWHTRATILLDDRAAAHDGYGEGNSFERSVEAAASLCDLYNRSGYGWKLLAAHHPGLPASKGGHHFNRCLDLLATIEPSPGEDGLALRLAEIEGGGSTEAALVAVTGSLTPDVGVALTRCRRRFRMVTAVSFPAHRFGSQATKSRWEGERQTLEIVRLLARSSVRTVILGPDDSLAVAWSTASGGRADQKEPGWGRKPELV